MTIQYDAARQLFHLQSRSTSYAFELIEGQYPSHVYWGRRIRGNQLHTLNSRQERASFSPNPLPNRHEISFDTMPHEYPGYGNSDFRTPAFEIQYANGTTVTDLRYESHEIVQGKLALAGLPATYVESDSEAETLHVMLRDSLSGIAVKLTYTVFNELDAITRSVSFVNEGVDAVMLKRVLSMSVDFQHDRYDMLHLSGAWSRERDVFRRALRPGMQSIESRRGSSSHMQNPFVAMLEHGATEDCGDVYGVSFVYSGSFIGGVEVDQFRTARLFMGINPFDFSWKLEAGEEFQAPEVVLVYSPDGLGGMSRIYHELYRTRLCRGVYRDATRPVLVNNWEATYFNFNADKLEAIAEVGSELGMELFVLDDGWFGKRDSDNSSLGDWFVDERKLPGGLKDVASRINKRGMQFGLWFEPEMISPNSELYRKHPDWCLHVPNRYRTQGRNQLVLDLSRTDVQQYLIDTVSDVLKSAPITYVKWDMNRNMTEIGSALLPADRQRETAHRYMLGLYHVLEEITTAFPDVLFESCSGGGGRFDPGMLCYMPQTWTSDNTDAISRLRIQYGTSIVYPISAMGAHVSEAPNHQVGRITSLETRGHVAMSGNFGYELDLTKFTEEEKVIVKDQIKSYKTLRGLIQFGDFYRLLSPFEGNQTAWMSVSKDKREAMAVYVQVLNEPNSPFGRIKLKGLSSALDYRLVGTDRVYGGDELMYAGIAMPLFHHDFASVLLHFVVE
ncbi:Alpha-galactosidase [Paenibacillus curdlanolyticus YK9]|uniref:Alpha-galactosidase n=1 Tax=Paenibacillus curdlanolyticus YK9 TaxID=717606 RepID=E0IE97_9BACL|nr:alpha-galactosidase [Paenibacillus curdlanolyticus]EFM08985.1 Alpha-galactosidase [Paenibacillus curdlanolyticus YK9]